MKTNIFTLFVALCMVVVLFLIACNSDKKDSSLVPDSPKQKQIGLIDSANKANLNNSVSTVKPPIDPKKDTLKFLTNSYELNLFEIQLSRLAETNALDPDVKNLALTIVAAHIGINAKISAITAAVNFTLPALSSATHQQELLEISKITGSSFDLRYTNAIISILEKSIVNYKNAYKNLPEGDTKTLAGEALIKIEDQFNSAKKISHRLK